VTLAATWLKPLLVYRQFWRGAGGNGAGSGRALPGGDGDAATDCNAVPNCVRTPGPEPADGAIGAAAERIEEGAFHPPTSSVPHAHAVHSPRTRVGATAAMEEELNELKDISDPLQFVTNQLR